MRNHFWSFPEGYYYTRKFNNKYNRECFLVSGDMMRCKWPTFLVPFSDLMKLFSRCVVDCLINEFLITKALMFLLKILW